VPEPQSCHGTAAPSQGLRRRLRIGHAWPLRASGLARPLAAFVRRNPDVRIELLEDGPDALRRRFRRGALDVVSGPARRLGPTGERCGVPEEPWALVTGREGLFDVHGADWSWLGERPLLMRPGDPWREAEAACRAAGGGACDVRLVRSPRASLFDLVGAGAGWSLAPESLAATFPAVAFHRLPPGGPRIETAVSWAPVLANSAVADFVALLRGASS
jgi:hypothetical protein